MEIEIEWKGLSSLWIGAAVVVIILLGVLGWMVTPEGGKVLTWEEWQIYRSRREYRRELTELQKACDEMSALLNKPLDPLRVLTVADRLTGTLEKQKQAALDGQRTAVLDAVSALRRWAQGDSREAAVSALENAIRKVEGAP
ncbi:hypothetical protein ATHL_00988 [Anaerolinea thermolimosa]|uniref:hypothetical protein n=1 Tax=Anaerolinea thermolimosa TaxID=229919 RepID=UPI00078455B2|nr:hypothetical protein [Anaerolinea thermolimosa]GAP06142.1 hypothetical protein ATHL_00988 [Anaerolinea thermolimosa]